MILSLLILSLLNLSLFVQENSGEPENLSDLMPRLLGEEIGSGPTPGHLVHALTLAAAGDRYISKCVTVSDDAGPFLPRWDMERLEILGDAFLKYSVGLFFHYKLSNDVTSSEYTGRSYNEGDLSSARAQVVSKTF